MLAAVFHSATDATDEGQLDTIAAIAKALQRGMDGRRVPHVAATILFRVLHGAADAIAAGEQRERWLEAVRDLARKWLAP
ncbi:hypothetical protein HCN51_16160 [Nonomuraea sp. FMUSA5-5]|uniref:MftR C-terminal domain-containing protein n=1 Tax=Nonomuraea composti TaxID=2720023 RepID=A0ABX1B3S5_9ACTN|nr:hypothetical protein [Nonomuraea sp. FMUSA5-5]NJP90974.1 hypothetical protein [Nonomuraea sp. FMUSA5-5]